MGRLIAHGDRLVHDEQLADPRDRMVIVAGMSLAAPNTMNGIILHTIGETWQIIRRPNVRRRASENRGGKHLLTRQRSANRHPERSEGTRIEKVTLRPRSFAALRTAWGVNGASLHREPT